MPDIYRGPSYAVLAPLYVCLSSFMISIEVIELNTRQVRLTKHPTTTPCLYQADER